MFRIDLEIKSTQPLHGLHALDERRRLGLPDAALLLIGVKRTTRWFEVSEEFARQHFGYQDNNLTAAVPVFALNKGDVTLVNNTLVIHENMTDERAAELFANHYEPENPLCFG